MKSRKTSLAAALLGPLAIAAMMVACESNKASPTSADNPGSAEPAGAPKLLGSWSVDISSSNPSIPPPKGEAPTGLGHRLVFLNGELTLARKSDGNSASVSDVQTIRKMNELVTTTDWASLAAAKGPVPTGGMVYELAIRTRGVTHKITTPGNGQVTASGQLIDAIEKMTGMLD